MVRLLALTLAFIALTASSASGSIPQPMVDALDQYAEQWASYQGWAYVDRGPFVGDYRHARVILMFIASRPQDPLEFDWHVHARIARCGPGWYVISTDLETNRCRRTATPPWVSWN